MTPWLARRFAGAWNRLSDWLRRTPRWNQLKVGLLVRDGRQTRVSVGIDHQRRTEHIAVLGKTGTGKTSLLRYMCAQDIERGHGFAFFDLHGDTTPFLLALIAAEEKRRGANLSDRTILIDPGDPERSVGLNILEAQGTQEAYVEIAEVTAILKHRWKLDTLGVRTEELLRHSLFVLISNGLTFLEIAPLLTSDAFRRACVAQTPPGEARSYFAARYDKLSVDMQAMYREAILNKVSLYASDPRFRHMIGQRMSTVNLKRAIDSGAWVLINLEKGRLGEEASTLGALLLSKLKHAILSRLSRRLFTLYCDELQNLVAYDAGIEVLLSEARKFGISIVSANQYLDQYPASMRAAILAMGSQAFLQLSGLDAQRIAYWTGEGKTTADRLRTLPTRHVMLRQTGIGFDEAVVPNTGRPTRLPLGLLSRVRGRWTRPRQEIEEEIVERHKCAAERNNSLGDEWK